MTEFPRERRSLALAHRSTPSIGADSIDTRFVCTFEGFYPATGFDSRHLLLGREPRKVEYFFIVDPHSPDASNVVLGVSSPQVPRQTVRIVNGPEEEERSKVQRTLSTDNVLLALLLVQGEFHCPINTIDLQKVCDPIVHDLWLVREGISVDAAAKIDYDVEESIVEFDREEISMARLAAVVEDKSVRFYGLEVELERSLSFCVPQRKSEIGVCLGERDGARFEGCGRIHPARDRVDVAVDFDVRRSGFDECNVDEVDVGW